MSERIERIRQQLIDSIKGNPKPIYQINISRALGEDGFFPISMDKNFCMLCIFEEFLYSYFEYEPPKPSRMTGEDSSQREARNKFSKDCRERIELVQKRLSALKEWAIARAKKARNGLSDIVEEVAFTILYDYFLPKGITRREHGHSKLLYSYGLTKGEYYTAYLEELTELEEKIETIYSHYKIPRP